LWPRQAREALFIPLLSLASQMRHQDRHQRGPKIYALHAPEMECIGKGTAQPNGFGCKVSVATPVTSPKDGQFVLHAKALHGNPYDGRTLGPTITDLEKPTGVETRRIHVDKGYRGHNHPHKFRVWISGQVRQLAASIRSEMRRRSAVEPVIGHLKAEHRIGGGYLNGPEGVASTGRKLISVPARPIGPTPSSSNPLEIGPFPLSDFRQILAMPGDVLPVLD
jgi:transposase, IS5 family